MIPFTPIVTGILSYGMSGKIFHTPFIANNKHFQFKAIVERTKKLSAERYPSVVSYDSVDELLADPEIELVVVNTPNDTHVDFASRALRAGKHVLIEKPVAPTAAEAKQLFDLAKEMGRYLLPYHNRRFDADFNALKEVIASEKIGKPVEIHLRFDRYRNEIGPKAFKETPRPGAGLLYDLGSHLLDQVISIFGIPERYHVIKSSNRDNSLVDDYATLLLSYAQGPTVHITVSMLVVKAQHSFMLHGTKGSFVKQRTDVQEQQLIAGMLPTDQAYGLEHAGMQGTLCYIAANGETVEEEVPLRKGDYNLVFDAVYAQIREGKSYFVTEEQILRQLEILASANS